MKKKGRQLPNMGLAALSIKIFFPAGEFICHILSFFAIYPKSRVGSEGVTGLRTRGRPPRLDDRSYGHDLFIVITLVAKQGPQESRERVNCKT
jgi:hypothetical protein